MAHGSRHRRVLSHRRRGPLAASLRARASDAAYARCTRAARASKGAKSRCSGLAGRVTSLTF